MRLAVLGLGFMVLVATGCGAKRSHHAAAKSPPATVAQKPTPTPVAAKRMRVAPSCSGATERTLTSARASYAGFAPNGAVAYRTPGGAVVARFGRENVNGYPTYFGVLGKRVGKDCRALWYRVQLPIRPNGAVGWVRASAIELQPVDLRIEVDVSRRQLTLFRTGKRVLEATVAVGASATPTPIGRYYVNQRLVPTDTSGPYGPGALGISAFSPVLTGWAQGGPVAIHGTNEPWSIGHAVSNGCIRLPNDTLSRLFKIVPPGTQVIIHP
ncbi:MAG TPA: L,D-transpeptidase [Gaiellaceae bacterium]|jgi:lipoprotein-anchoring transpeptidase ErfK/SrfK